VTFENPLMNASGVFSDSPYLLKEWEEAGVGGVVTKSITLEEKKPNDFSYNDGKIICIRGNCYTINSMGLPNKGVAWWKDRLSRYEFNVPVIASVATASGDLNEYNHVMRELSALVDMFEVNVSCQNTGKIVIGTDMSLLRSVLAMIDVKNPVSIKIPCYHDEPSLRYVMLEYDTFGTHWLNERVVVKVPEKVDETKICLVLDVLDDHDITCVTSHNTISVDHPLIPSGRGGLSGRLIHDIAVEQARTISEYSNIDIIASGGVLTSRDVRDFLEIKNVKMVQLASGLFQHESPHLFIDDIKKHLLEGNEK